MTTPAYYRGEATKCRTRANADSDAAAAARWRRMAQEYDILADRMEAADREWKRRTQEG
jgi:hypothetical protein